MATEFLKTPNFIQRGVIQKRDLSLPISKAVSLEYMGNSYFEFGALPASLKRLNEKQDRLDYAQAETLQAYDGRPLILYGDFKREFRASILKPINEDGLLSYKNALYQAAHREIHLEEGFGVEPYLDPENQIYGLKGKLSQDTSPKERRRIIKKALVGAVDFWWDIENDVMMSFDETFMRQIKHHLNASWQKMNLSHASDISPAT